MPPISPETRVRDFSTHELYFRPEDGNPFSQPDGSGFSLSHRRGGRVPAVVLSAGERPDVVRWFSVKSWLGRTWRCVAALCLQEERKEFPVGTLVVSRSHHDQGRIRISEYFPPDTTEGGLPAKVRVWRGTGKSSGIEIDISALREDVWSPAKSVGNFGEPVECRRIKGSSELSLRGRGVGPLFGLEPASIESASVKLSTFPGRGAQKLTQAVSGAMELGGITYAGQPASSHWNKAAFVAGALLLVMTSFSLFDPQSS